MIAAAVAVAVDAPSWFNVLAFAFTALGEVLAIVFVYRILVRGGSAASNLLWMAVILTLPWIGLLLYYLMPRQLQLRRLKRIRHRGQRARSARLCAGAEEVVPASETGLLTLLTDESGDGPRGGNSLEWIAGGEEFFAAAEAAIGAATRQVHCLVYILRPDEAGLRFLAHLAAAARRGVTVRLLFDSFGSLGLKNAHLEALRAAGGRAEAFLPLLWRRRPFTINLRNHRKVLVVDGEIAFVGGRNIGNEYRSDRLGRTQRWLDAMVAVRGPAVEPLQDVFVEDWCTATDELLEDALGPAVSPGHERVGVACSGPDREQSRLWFALVQLLGEAQRTIDLSSPYLVPPPVLLFALQLAAARGVRVRVHTNGPKSEAAVLYFAQRHHYRRLLRAGIEILETVEDYNHSKLLVVDGRAVVVGSANMDLRSADLNFEIALVVPHSEEFAARVLATVEQRVEACRRVTLADLPAHPLVRAVDGFCGLLSPLL